MYRNFIPKRDLSLIDWVLNCVVLRELLEVSSKVYSSLLDAFSLCLPSKDNKLSKFPSFSFKIIIDVSGLLIPYSVFGSIMLELKNMP